MNNLRPISDFNPQEFTLFLKSKDAFLQEFAESTISRYTRIARYFLDFCANEGFETFDEVTPQTLRKWLIGTNKDKPTFSQSTRNVTSSALMLLYDYFQNNGFSLDNPVTAFTLEQKRKNRGGRAPKRLPSVLSWAEQDALFSEILHSKQEATSARDYAMIALLLVTGLRCDELCGLQNVHLDLDAARLRVVGKGDKERIVRFNYDAAFLKTAFDLYAPYRVANSPFVIHSRTGAPLTHALVYQQVSKYIAKVAPHLPSQGPHLLRHTSLSRQLAKGVQLLQVMENAGHTSISTLQIYLHLLA